MNQVSKNKKTLPVIPDQDGPRSGGSWKYFQSGDSLGAVFCWTEIKVKP